MYLIETLAALLPNITSLTYLRINYPVDDSGLLVLIDLVQSHTTLEVLELGMEDFFDEYGNNEPLVLSNLPGLLKLLITAKRSWTFMKNTTKYLQEKMKMTILYLMIKNV